MNKSAVKSIGAVLAGFLTVAVLSIVTDAILEKTGIFPSYESQMQFGSPVWLLVTALIYRSIYTLIGGFVTAKLSPVKPMRQVIILGIIGTIAATAGIIGGWKLGNQWYPIALAVTGFPLIWLGGKLSLNKK